VTRPTQKKRERFFVEEATRSLGVGWTIDEECDPPDFLITEDHHHFGLDVADIFVGHQNEHGSMMKRGESDLHKVLDKLRLQYEAKTGINLVVKFLGRIEPDTLEAVVPRLLALDLASKPPGYQESFEILLGLEAPLKLFVTKSLRPEWYSVGDRVGWVTRTPNEIIAAEIEKKGKKLLQYKSLVGDDVRLLLVADGIKNSGKIAREIEGAFLFHGFKKVYLFPYPENAIALCEAN
jgi:hypothetical protein